MKGLAGSSCGLSKLKVDPTLNRKYIPKTLTMKYLPTMLWKLHLRCWNQGFLGSGEEVDIEFSMFHSICKRLWLFASTKWENTNNKRSVVTRQKSAIEQHEWTLPRSLWMSNLHMYLGKYIYEIWYNPNYALTKHDGDFTKVYPKFQNLLLDKVYFREKKSRST